MSGHSWNKNVKITQNLQSNTKGFTYNFLQILYVKTSFVYFRPEWTVLKKVNCNHITKLHVLHVNLYILTHPNS